MRSSLVVGAVAASLLIAACGTQRTSDLFLVKRTGKIPGANLTLLVSDDGTASCNGGPKKQMGNELLLEARELAAQLAKDQNKPIAAIGVVNPIYDFAVSSGAGGVRWQDGNPHIPDSFKQTAYFTRRVAKQVCGLTR